MGWLLTTEHVKDADIVDMMDPITDSCGTSAYSIALLVYNRKGKGKYVSPLGSFLSKRRKKEKLSNGGFALLGFRWDRIGWRETEGVRRHDFHRLA